jgi:hypothetical protein
MSNPNKHHYLPVFYLNRWTGSDLRLVRFYRPYQRVVASRLTPEYTGFEEGLYSLDGFQDDEREIIETEFFSPVDNEAAIILEELIAHGASRLTGAQRSSWIRFIMSLQLRGPHSLMEIEAVLSQSMEEVFERQSGAHSHANSAPRHSRSSYEHAREKSPEEFKNAYKRLLPQLIDHEKIGQRIINMLWYVFDFSAAPFTLLTADRPLATSHGLLDARCILSVPLSPTHLFVAVNEVQQLQTLANQNRRDTVRNANKLVVKLAVQNVYGASEEHLRFVENRLRRRGELIVPGLIALSLREPPVSSSA